jgi:hypothetical protein
LCFAPSSAGSWDFQINDHNEDTMNHSALISAPEPDDVDIENENVSEEALDDEMAPPPGLRAYTDGEPPGDLDVDTYGVPPQRARLARYQAWLVRTQAELEALTAGRARFLESMGAPAVTEEKIAALIESDRLGLVSWMRAGAAGITPAQIQTFERQRLEETLANDRHAAEVARGALDQVEREVRDKRQQLEALEQRRDKFAQDAVVEVVEAIGAEYRKQARAMREVLVQLMGANAAIAALGFAGNTPTDVTVRLPGFRLGPIRERHAHDIQIAKREIQTAAGPWRQLLRLWADDARASPPLTDANTDAVEAAPEPLPDHLQAAVDAIIAAAEGSDWAGIISVIAERVVMLRLAAEDGGPFVDGELPELVAAIIDAIGEGDVRCADQAKTFSFSAMPEHRIAAATWFEQHPGDRPADDRDIVEVLGGSV